MGTLGMMCGSPFPSTFRVSTAQPVPQSQACTPIPGPYPYPRPAPPGLGENVFSAASQGWGSVTAPGHRNPAQQLNPISTHMHAQDIQQGQKGSRTFSTVIHKCGLMGASPGKHFTDSSVFCSPGLGKTEPGSRRFSRWIQQLRGPHQQGKLKQHFMTPATSVCSLKVLLLLERLNLHFTPVTKQSRGASSVSS